MIKFENVEVMGWEAAIRGMRNPMNSWAKCDSDYRTILCKKCDSCETMKLETWENCIECTVNKQCESNNGFMIGPNDLDLMTRLCKAGTAHRKFMRMITVYVDITAPLYWWKEFDTYKVGTVANSCSTMHKIAEKAFTIDDFSHEHLFNNYGDSFMNLNYTYKCPKAILEELIDILNCYRTWYNVTKDKKYWWQMIQLLPSSYNQRRTVMLNYEVLANIFEYRNNHKLDEWVNFCEWIASLPYPQIICGTFKAKV